MKIIEILSSKNKSDIKKIRSFVENDLVKYKDILTHDAVDDFF